MTATHKGSSRYKIGDRIKWCQCVKGRTAIRNGIHTASISKIDSGHLTVDGRNCHNFVIYHTFVYPIDTPDDQLSPWGPGL